MFADIRQFVELTFSSGGGLGMGVSEIKDCKASYLRTEGGVKVCADGNATNNWDTPPEGGWGFYNNTADADFPKVKCPADGFCPKKEKYF